MPRQIDFMLPPPDGVFDAVARLAAGCCGARVGVVALTDSAGDWARDDAARFGRALSTSLFVRPGTALSSAALRRIAAPEAALAHGLPFYAGVPIRSADGETIGTLAVADTEPRTFDDAMLEELKLLATLVSDAMALRLEARAHLASRAREMLSSPR